MGTPSKKLRTFKKVDLKLRSSLRGLKRCSGCHEINGQRAFACRNMNCKLRQTKLSKKLPFDPVQLINNTGVGGSSYFSLRNKERDAQPRNFVHMSEIVVTQDVSQSTIVSRNAVCFVDTCRYDASDATGTGCKHVKACTADANKAIPLAEVYTITREVIWNLNISLDQKQRIWQLYKTAEKNIPAVQRINATTFVVKCTESSNFQAGFLHVTVVQKENKAKKHNSSYSCVCQKLKIIVESDNSVVMEKEVCDHILLVLAAVISRPNGKKQYECFTNALKQFWMPTTLEIPLLDATQDDSFFGPNINIGGHYDAENNQSSADDIFIFGEEYLPNEIPDLSDVIFDLTPSDMLSMQQTSNVTATSVEPTTIKSVNYTSDPNLVSSCVVNEEDQDMNFAITTAATVATGLSPETVTMPVNATHLELSDCNIELMDQFQLTNQIDLCSDDISFSALVSDQSNLYSFLNNATVPLANATATVTATSTSLTGDENYSISSRPTATTSLLKSNNLLTSATTSVLTTEPTVIEKSLPPIELPTIAIKKGATKASAVITEVKTRKFPHIPAKRALIVNTPNNATPMLDVVAEVVDATTEPSLAYSAWLEYVIETINASIEITTKSSVQHTFNVHEEIFSHFSKTFSAGLQRRMPNFTSTVRTGKHKGLIKYTWYFTRASTVSRIFNTKNMSIELERVYQQIKGGVFTPYVREQNVTTDEKYKRIFPKLSLYKVHIWFDCKNTTHKSFKVEWLPNAFPKSHYGILNIEFSIEITDPTYLKIKN